MSVYGKIKTFEIITLERELSEMKDTAIENYIKEKHETAERNRRNIVRFSVEDPRSDKPQVVSVFIPKGATANNLIEVGTEIECNSASCHLKIIGVQAKFDRAYNGASEIHDVRVK